MEKKSYQKPELEVIEIGLEGSVLMFESEPDIPNYGGEGTDSGELVIPGQN